MNSPYLNLARIKNGISLPPFISIAYRRYEKGEMPAATAI